ncbi:2,5-dioxovalerate dehydrogenase [Shewanella sairae]|uniref:2,5-dioxovalerate dehydrogenase n=1 Tax=Shewanella sairae TaxID=190310 RepID=A0ABQ4PPD5_9GAMM|nr:aldehyde dehydrogenase (NADP(+)) [Shewanella sairae]MCL1132050.1 aldehyde dehydrogenase (NADP(+)) [Shewanella sairae]GIU50588.1 2,5-dioxovalerate dehydrogenase [Shewanella sairae]
MTDLNKVIISGQHFINGAWSNEATDFSSTNPISNEPLAYRFANASKTNVEDAVAAAKQAFMQYRSFAPARRAEFLEAIADEIQADIEAITQTAHLETGLPMARLQGETGRTCGQLRLFAGNLRNPIDTRYVDLANAERQPLPKPDTRLTTLPLGPVAVFGASNFPLAFSTAGGDTASALAAGCAIVVKGHPAHAATSELVTRAIARATEKCDMPNGVFNLVQGFAPDVSTQLVTAPAIKAVGFTGSLKVGRILSDLCAARAEPIPFYGELGSTNPQFILANILEEQAESLATTQVQSMLMGHGQFCTSPGVIVAVKGAALNRYQATLAQDVASQGAANMLTAGIASTYQTQIDTLLSNPKVELIAQGESSPANHFTRPVALKVSATDFINSVEVQQEVFGPCAILVECDDKAQMQLIAEQLEGQLTASIHGLDNEFADNHALIEAIAFNVGRLIFNQMPTGVEVCHSMNHGGPYPASTDSRTTSVGSAAMARFERPICYQNMPKSLLPLRVNEGEAGVITF